jgi:hypothetical protein
MPRRELLTPTERVQLFAFPSDESELIRLATLARGRPHVHSASTAAITIGWGWPFRWSTCVELLLNFERTRCSPPQRSI